MTYNCELFEQAAQPILSVRATTSVQGLPQALGEAFGAVAQYLSELGEAPAGAPFAAYYNMDAESLEVEGGFPVGRVIPGRGNVQAGEIPAGLNATCLHSGPYGELGLAYEALTEWVKEQGYEASGVAYEFYLNDPTETPPQELKTQILFPLKTG